MNLPRYLSRIRRRSDGLRFATLLACLLLGACAGRPVMPTPPSDIAWQAHSQSVAALAVWQLAARVAIRVPETGWSASLYWTQHQDAFEMRIIAPLGRGTVMIEGDDDTMALQTTDGVALTGEGVDIYLREQFGWEMPVRALRYWVRGIPDPSAAAPDLTFDDRGRLVSLQQAGWTLAYDRYLDVNDTALPTRISAERDGMTLRLSINRWDLDS